jgi:hypothetical protein
MDFLKEATIFNPSSGVAKGGPTTMVSTSFAKKIPYYVLPETMSLQAREYFVFYIAALGTSEGQSMDAWKSWIVTYVCAVTPAVSKMLSSKMFQAMQLSSPKALLVTEVFEKVEKAIDSNDADLVTKLTTVLANLDIFEGMPKMKAGLSLTEANGEWNYKILMCHFSIVLFLAGKRVAGDDHSQITVARPKALKSKAHLDDTIDLLEGSFRLSNKAHTRINDAWSEMGALRAVVFTEYAKFESATADESQNLIWTTMHLLRFSGMSHAAIVFNFLQVCPWVYEIPTLRPAIAAYGRSVVEAAKVDPKMFPYMKLILGDKSTFFQRKELEPLIACAVSVLTETNPTLAGYFTKPEFAPIVEAFNLKREAKERETGSKIGIEVPKPKFEDEESDEEES